MGAWSAVSVAREQGRDVSCFTIHNILLALCFASMLNCLNLSFFSLRLRHILYYFNFMFCYFFYYCFTHCSNFYLPVYLAFQGFNLTYFPVFACSFHLRGSYLFCSFLLCVDGKLLKAVSFNVQAVFFSKLFSYD